MPFSAHVQEKARLPLRTVELLPTDFADEWPDKPNEAVKVGLRLVSDSEMQTARSAAGKAAIEQNSTRDEQIAAFNDALMTWAVGSGTCDPENAKVSWLGAGVDNIPLALTSRAIRRLWDELEQLHIESSPLHSEASDAELDQLAARLVSRLWNRNMTPGAEKRARKLLGFIIAECGELGDHELTE